MPLPVARTADGQACLAAVAADPAHALFATDYDGTLAPIVDDPAQAVPAPGAVAALARLAGRVGTVAIITGRAAADAVSLGGLAAVPGLIVLGHYGAQRWQAGVLSDPPVPPGVQAVREALPGLLAELAAPDGTTVEDKGTALAVHTRRTADPAAAFALLRGPLGRLADSAALTLEPGRLVLELRPPGTDKGTTPCAEAMAAERAARSAMFCGDDLGDLTAFAAIRRLRADGIPGRAVASESRRRRRWPTLPTSSSAAPPASCGFSKSSRISPGGMTPQYPSGDDPPCTPRHGEGLHYLLRGTTSPAAPRAWRGASPPPAIPPTGDSH